MCGVSCSTVVRQGWEVKCVFAAVISRRKVPALDVTARDLTSVFLGACFVLYVKLCNFLHGSMFIVQCQTIPHDHPCWCLFAVHTVQQYVFCSSRGCWHRPRLFSLYRVLCWCPGYYVSLTLGCVVVTEPFDLTSLLEGARSPFQIACGNNARIR